MNRPDSLHPGEPLESVGGWDGGRHAVPALDDVDLGPGYVAVIANERAATHAGISSAWRDRRRVVGGPAHHRQLGRWDVRCPTA